MDTFAYSNFPSVLDMAGNHCPMAIPTTMQIVTHTVRYCSKKPIPFFLSPYPYFLAVTAARAFRQFFLSDFCNVETGKGISDFVTNTAEL